MRFLHDLQRPVPRLWIAFAVLAALLTPARLGATPVNYNLSSGVPDYSGYSGYSDYSDYAADGGSLNDLAFTIDGQTFSLGGTSWNTFASFLEGQLRDTIFTGNAGSARSPFTLDPTDGYAFFGDDGSSASYGSFASYGNFASLLDASSPTSEPASLVLFGTGLFLSIGVLYRTRSARFTSKVHPPEA